MSFHSDPRGKWKHTVYNFHVQNWLAHCFKVALHITLFSALMNAVNTGQLHVISCSTQLHFIFYIKSHNINKENLSKQVQWVLLWNLSIVSKRHSESIPRKPYYFTQQIHVFKKHRHCFVMKHKTLHAPLSHVGSSCNTSAKQCLRAIKKDLYYYGQAVDNFHEG